MYLKLIILILFLTCNLNSAEKEINENKIESIIKKYILENPEVIIESLEKFTVSQKEKEKEDIVNILSNFYDKKEYLKLPSIGNKKNDLIIVEFIDYNCGYCKKTLPIISKLMKNFKNIQIVFVDYPILSETSEIAARASLAAHEQKAYFKYHAMLLNNLKSINEDSIYRIARDLGLNIKKFKKDMESSKIKNNIINNIKLARSLKIRGTPTFIIKDQILPGAYEYDKLEKIIMDNS
ncbi:MAG: hypothetical protein CBC22_08400 [Alphaproteobacteria bacterium TMED62]|nr:MAG: hypothetical protein CBC22_08400 [Alphaproteobacteria bacterium TMED62]|tara:strand:+ start:6899 stop:7609 length:711 start_codon:yes stop_codon:yes gene_type:complete